MTPLDLPALTAIAQAATPGPWDAHRGIAMAEVVSPQTREPNGDVHVVCCVNFGDDDATDQEHRDTAHIAAFSPSTCLALLERIRQLEAGLVEALGLLQIAEHHYGDDERSAEERLAKLATGGAVE
jgi:hypothetical protein